MDADSARKAITVLIADDHAIVRDGLRLIIEGDGEMQVIGETGDVPGTLVRAIRAVAAGQTYLQPELGALVLQAKEPSSDEQLTERERQVLRMIAMGYTNAQISEQLFLSVRTIESHRARIQQKLGVSGRAELIRYALDHGLIER